jgi:hypothetical protein
MVNIFDHWEKPLPRADEKQELEAILSDYSRGDLDISGTTEEELVRLFSSYKNRKDLSYEELKHGLDKAASFCLDGVFSNRGEEQMKYVRRLLMINDAYERFEKEYPYKEWITGLLKKIQKKREIEGN